MEILGVSFGKKYRIRYKESVNDKVLKSTEIARPEFGKALRDAERQWSEAAYKEIYGKELETYEQKRVDDGEIAREQIGKTSLFLVNAVSVDYAASVVDSYTLSGTLTFMDGLLNGPFSCMIKAGMYPALDLSMSWLLSEARRYVEGDRAQQTLPGLPKVKAEDGERPHCSTCPYAENENGKIVCKVSGEVFDKEPLWCKHEKERAEYGNTDR